MSKSNSSTIIGPMLLELIGVPTKNCIKATIYCEGRDPVTVDAEYYTSMEINPCTKEIDTVIKKYVLVERKKYHRMKLERDRLLVLATKYCPKEHRDWEEILKIAGGA